MTDDFAKRPETEREEPDSPSGEDSTEGLSNPDLHGAARDVAEHAADSDGDDAAKTAGG